MEDFINQLLDGQVSNVNKVNEAERDGNVSTALFEIDQAAVSLTGGTNVQVSPTEALIQPIVNLATTEQGRQSLYLVLIAAAAAWAFGLFGKRK